MPEIHPPLLALAIGGLVCAVIGILRAAMRADARGNVVLAVVLSAAFGAYTAFTIAREGVMTVVVNHTFNLWGVQVWWDLLSSLTIAMVLIAPRAKAAGMNLLPWALFVLATASIGLFAMAARLFWLERQSDAAGSIAG
jgi:hypothetical protein